MRALLLLLALRLMSALAYSAEPAPNFIDYQGRLFDTTGAPLPSGLAEVEFRIWNQADGGTVIWAERQFVTVVNGDVSVRLGAGQAITQSGADIGLIPHTVGLASVFLGSERYLGITVIQGDTPREIAPRLGFIATAFAMVAQTANTLDQAEGTVSKINVSGIGFSTQTLGTSQTLVLDKHTNLINARDGVVSATLPADGSNQGLVVTKIDDSLNMVRILPGAGTINGTTGIVYLKVRGESVTLQNAGANAWWIVADSRDRTPVGSVYSYGAATPPPGYLMCDGKLYDNTLYPELQGALMGLWGTAGTQFRVPDLQGRFLRGANGSNNGAVGTTQEDSFAAHTHRVVLPAHKHELDLPEGQGLTRLGGVNGEDNTPSGIDSDESGVELNLKGLNTLSISSSPPLAGTVTDTVGAETRPINAAVTFIVKY